MTSFSLILAAFFLSPTASDGLKPVELTGDMRADWTNHAATAEACVVDVVPTENILNQWKRLGVRILKRVAYDSECSAEYFRRKVGFLAVHEEADGVWLVGEDKFPATWKQSLAEAKIDVAVTLYCKSLAEEALGWKAKDHKVWIEGRRVMWFLKFMDFDAENLDTLRLEFICYAKRLEQLLGKPEKKLPLIVSKPIEPDRPAFEPLADRSPEHVAVSIDGKGPVELGEGFSFSCNNGGVNFQISSKSGAKDVWPGGRGSFRLYLPDGQGSYLPYEFKLDLSPIDLSRAPVDAYGLWFLEERWGKGKLHLYADPHTWRLVPVARGSYGSKYPKLHPRFDFKWGEKGGWTLNLSFSWLSVYGFWPSMRNGIGEKWYVSLDALPGVPAAACRLDWAKGRELNFKKLAAGGLSCRGITERYAEQKLQASGIYHLWFEERLYGYAKTAKPTYQRCDPESDKIFWERVVEPMVDANRNTADITYTYQDKDHNWIPAKLGKQSETVKLVVWKSLGKLFDLAERVSLARRDYILMRYAGKMPPEPPPKKKPEGAETISAPDVDNDDDAIQLDDKEF